MAKSKVTPMPREWLCRGGGGHEDGEDGLRAMTLSGEALVETLEAYRRDLGYDRLRKVERLARKLADELVRYSRCYPQWSTHKPFDKAHELLALCSPKGSSRASE